MQSFTRLIDSLIANYVPKIEFFYGTQYHPIPQVEKDSYAIENDLYIRIRLLRLILYRRFFRVKSDLQP
jgi:hypothetical protein